MSHQNNHKSEKLKSTLSELEDALSGWNNPDLIGESDPDQILMAERKTTNSLFSSSKDNLPYELRQKTRLLLNQLKEQIDELDGEE